MFSKRTLAVMKREFRDKLLSKTFIIMTVLIPIFLFGILGLQTFLLSFDDDEGAVLDIVSASEELTVTLNSEFSDLDWINNRDYSLSFETMDSARFREYLQTRKPDILNGSLTGMIYIPESAMTDKRIEYYSQNPNNNTLFNKIRGTINTAFVDLYFEGRDISDDDIDFARNGVDFNPFRITEDEEISEEGFGNEIVAFLFTFLLYFSLIMIGTMMMRSVVEEKNNRIVEILLSSVNSKELMTGKILGTSITGLIQMAIWLSPVMLLISTSWFVLPKDLTVNISMMQILYFLINYFIGLVTFTGLFASVGAIFDNDQDAQSGIWPIMILIMIPFFIAITVPTNPQNVIARVASIVPFGSIMVMPARVSMIDVPTWEFILSLVLSVVTLVLIFILAGKIYRIGILKTGKKPKWSEVVKWVKYKY